jgi:hypothetical protein
MALLFAGFVELGDLRNFRQLPAEFYNARNG